MSIEVVNGVSSKTGNAFIGLKVAGEKSFDSFVTIGTNFDGNTMVSLTPCSADSKLYVRQGLSKKTNKVWFAFGNTDDGKLTHFGNVEKLASGRHIVLLTPITPRK